ncbi:MAG: zinc-ribbon domain-containing protein [Promethearchaeota archaeon]
MTQYAYCTACKKEISTPVRKPIETFQKVLWIILIVGTLGIAAPIFAIYYLNRPKNYCPTCLSPLKFSKEPFKKEEGKEEEIIPSTPKEKVLKKAGKEIKPRKKEKQVQIREEGKQIVPIDKTFCPYCGEDISPDDVKCPYCHSTLKTPYEKE